MSNCVINNLYKRKNCSLSHCYRRSMRCYT